MRALLLILVSGYRRLVSPWMPPACRFTPSCSEYAEEAIERHGALRGCAMAARRLLRCHPWGGSGYDPVKAPERAAGTDSTGQRAGAGPSLKNPARAPDRTDHELKR